MKFHNILDEILGNKTKVRLLRAFFMYPEKGFTESELERIAGIPQASVHRNVKSLLDNGLLDRKRIGKANLFSLNKEHVLYPLLNSNFGLERNVIAELKTMISDAVKNLAEVELVVLFGSIVKGMERSDSDVDIFIVCKGETSKLEDKLKDLTNISQNKFGNPISLMIKHKRELQDLKTRSIFSEIKNGEIIFKREGFEW
ncbi:MAG: nucleotidyltransferase domain-containing protein [Euryarchaeota archaeon]|nr:nucleotidyltransferase domain-containing protein [Euryarchaeota archaeon]MBU4454194.1 nucleotidyltransferase domain-containing protein [Euryarchaeota archaeon]